MNLDLLETLIEIKKGYEPSRSEDVAALLQSSWIVEGDEGFRLTSRAESSLQSAIGLMANSGFDPRKADPYMDQITYEIKRNARELIKTKTLTIKLYATPDIMNEITTRLEKDDWKVGFTRDAVTLTAKPDHPLYRLKK